MGHFQDCNSVVEQAVPFDLNLKKGTETTSVLLIKEVFAFLPLIKMDPSTYTLNYSFCIPLERIYSVLVLLSLYVVKQFLPLYTWQTTSYASLCPQGTVGTLLRHAWNPPKI